MRFELNLRAYSEKAGKPWLWSSSSAWPWSFSSSATFWNNDILCADQFLLSPSLLLKNTCTFSFLASFQEMYQSHCPKSIGCSIYNGFSMIIEKIVVISHRMIRISSSEILTFKNQSRTSNTDQHVDEELCMEHIGQKRGVSNLDGFQKARQEGTRHFKHN